MPLFEITTTQVVACAYIMDALSEDEARQRIAAGDAASFASRVTGEHIDHVIELVHGDASEKDVIIAMDNLHGRGFV